MSPPRVVLGAAVTSFAAGFSWLAIRRHEAFETGRFDLGNMVQAIWSTAHGRPLEATDLHGEQFTRLGAHFDPILAAFAPLWRVWPDPRLLLAAQAVALAAGAVPVFLLARRRVSEWSALALAGAYLLYPPLQWLALADFHAVALATPLLLWAFCALDAGRLLAFALFAGTAVLTKEQVGLVVAAMGVWYALARGGRRAGLVIAGLGTGVAALAVLVVVPAFAPGGESVFASRYDAPTLGGRDVGYVLRLLAPLGGLPLLSPLAALTALPELALNVLSSTRTQTSIHYQYTAAAIPGLVAATVLAAGRFRAAPALALLAAALGGALAGPSPGAYSPDAHDSSAARAVALVPEHAAVSATNSLGAHLSARRRILSFPLLRDAEWIAIDRRHPSLGDRVGVPLGPVLRRLRLERGWRLVFAEDGVLVYRRR